MPLDSLDPEILAEVPDVAAPDAVQAPEAAEAFDAPEEVREEPLVAQRLRFVVLQDQVHAAAAKIRLLTALGLTRTVGYGETQTVYETKLADFQALKARLGL